MAQKDAFKTGPQHLARFRSSTPVWCGPLAAALVVSSVVWLDPAQASAVDRVNAGEVSCGQLQSIINTKGAAIVRYPSTSVPGLPRYDTFVRTGSLCERNQVQTGRKLRSRDGECHVVSCQISNHQN